MSSCLSLYTAPIATFCQTSIPINLSSLLLLLCPFLLPCISLPTHSIPMALFFLLFLFGILCFPAISFPLSRRSLSSSIRQSSPRPSKPCASFCQYSLCSYRLQGSGENITFPPVNSSLLRPSGTASFPYICRNGTSLAQILSSGEALIREGDKFVPISKWSPSGLDTPFSSSVLSFAQIPRTVWSGVSREDVTPDQWASLNGKCVVLPITKYQLFNPRSKSAKPVTVPAPVPKESCVAVKLVAPTIHVQLVWEAGDDYDVDIIEPDGTRLFWSSPRSEAGNWTGGVQSYCQTEIKYQREDIVYMLSKNLQRGNYRVEVRHWGSCRNEFAPWRLAATVNGEIRLRLDGVSNFADSTTIIGRGSFDYI